MEFRILYREGPGDTFVEVDCVNVEVGDSIHQHAAAYGRALEVHNPSKDGLFLVQNLLSFSTRMFRAHTERFIGEF